jgi:NADH dehydrogenase
MFKEKLRDYTKGALEERGVEVVLGEIVESVEPTRVRLKSGKVLEAHTLVWGAGLQASPLAAALGLELQRGNRIATEADLSIAGHPETFAVGDIAWTTDTKTDEVLPQLGSVALQAGDRAGKNIARLLDGKETEPFRYHDKGTMATIGPGAAVVQLPRGRTLHGEVAWLAWGAVHLALLSTGEDRAKAIVDWTWAGFTHERGARISVEA